MPSNPITPEEQYDILINRSLTPRDGVTTETYMAAGYITMPPATVDGPVKWRLFDAAYIKTGIIDPNRLGTGATGAGNLYLADDGTWKAVSGGGGGGGTVTSVGVTVPTGLSVSPATITSSGTFAITYAAGYAIPTTASQTNWDTAYTNRITSLTTTGSSGAATLAGNVLNIPNYGSALTGYVPYTGATGDVNLGTHQLLAARGTFSNNGSSDTLTVNHTSGSGYGIIVTKGGANEALYVNKTSGSGNAMTVVGGRTSLVDLALSSVSNAAGDFLTLSGGVVHRRTAAQVLSDISVPTPTLAQVTTAGNTTTNAITVGGLTVATNLIYTDTVNGRVGIGTLTPFGKVDVRDGEIFVTTSTNANLRSRLTYQGLYVSRASDGTYQEQIISTNSAWQYHSRNSHVFYRDTLPYFSMGSLVVGSFINVNTTGNVLINTSTDAGYKLDVNGTVRVQSNLTMGLTMGIYWGTQLILTRPGSNGSTILTGGTYFRILDSTNTTTLFQITNADGTVGIGTGTTVTTAKLTVGGSITASSALAQGVYFNNTLVAAANNDVLVGLDINPTFTNGAFTGVQNYALRLNGYQLFSSGGVYATSARTTALVSELNHFVHSRLSSSGIMGFKINHGADSSFWRYNAGSGDTEFGTTNAVTPSGLQLYTANSIVAKFFSTGNLFIGTSPIDAGYKLDVVGKTRALASVESIFRVEHTNGNYATIEIGAGGNYAAGDVVMTRNNTVIFTTNGGYFQLGAGNVAVRLPNTTFQVLGGFGAGTIGTSVRLASYTINQGAFTATSGIQNTVVVGDGTNETWQPASGNATYNLFSVVPVINTTGTYAGIVRGIYYNPTLTSTTGVTHRAIETTSGNVIFGASGPKLILQENVATINNPSALSILFGQSTTAGYATGIFSTYSGAWNRGILTLAASPTGNNNYNVQESDRNIVLTGTTTDLYKATSVNNKNLSFINDTGNSGTLSMYWNHGQAKVGLFSSAVGSWGRGDFRIAVLNTTDTTVVSTAHTRFMVTADTYNVLIGTTTDAGYKLDVNGSVNIGSSSFPFASNLVTLTSNAGTSSLRIGGGNTLYVSGALTASNLAATDYVWVVRVLVGNGLARLTATTTDWLSITDSGQTANGSGNLSAKFATFGTTYATINASAQVEIASTTKGFLQPRMTNAQALAITTPATGLQAYDTTNNKNLVYNGTAWQNIATESWVTAQGYTSNVGTVTSVATGTGLTGGTITGSGTISLANTAVTAGAYTNANITVDAQGRITAASNGSGGGGSTSTISIGATSSSNVYSSASVVGHMKFEYWSTDNPASGKQETGVLYVTYYPGPIGGFNYWLDVQTTTPDSTAPLSFTITGGPTLDINITNPNPYGVDITYKITTF